MLHCTRTREQFRSDTVKDAAMVLFTFPLGRMRNIVMSVSVCLSGRIYPKLRGRTSPNFLSMLTAAVTRSPSGGVAMRYVLPVLSMTSCFGRAVSRSMHC